MEDWDKGGEVKARESKEQRKGKLQRVSSHKGYSEGGRLMASITTKITKVLTEQQAEKEVPEQPEDLKPCQNA